MLFLFSCALVSDMLIYLFLASFRGPLDLHSFPTRRSSDLRQSTRAMANSRQHFHHHAFPWVPYHRRRFDPRTSRLDRKSTRLNSSHLVISYAVFCLKKKKEQDRELYVVILKRIT